MRTTTDDRIRKEIAHQAAKLVAVDGLEDYLMAKTKAAQQLGINNKRMLPTNREIEMALIEYQTLFHCKEQQQSLKHFRVAAFKAMEMLNQFESHLVGSVLTGTASKHSEVIIHIYSDTPEYVSFVLEEKSIPVTICERRVKTNKDSHEYFTAFKFIAGEINLVLIVLPSSYIKKPAFDPVNGRPMKRANIEKVKTLIQ